MEGTVPKHDRSPGFKGDHSGDSSRVSKGGEEKGSSRKRQRKSKWDVIAPELPVAVPVTAEPPPSARMSPATLLELPRLFVADFPVAITDVELLQFFNGALLAIAGRDLRTATSADMPAVAVEAMNFGMRACFLRLKTDEDVQNCLKLSGIRLSGYPLRILKADDPSIPPAFAIQAAGISKAVEQAASLAAVVSGSQKASENDPNVTITDIAASVAEGQLRTLLEHYGKLARFEFQRNPSTGQCRGWAVAEYEDLGVTDIAIQGLDGVQLGARGIRLRRGKHPPSAGGSAASPFLPGGGTVATLPSSMTQLIFANPAVGAQVRNARKMGDIPSQVLQLVNAVLPEELINDEDFQAIQQDFISEGAKFGQLIQVVVPRPTAELHFGPGVGKIFLHYSDVTSARRARQEFNGRRYNQRRVVCAAFFPLDVFLAGKFTLLDEGALALAMDRQNAPKDDVESQGLPEAAKA